MEVGLCVFTFFCFVFSSSSKREQNSSKHSWCLVYVGPNLVCECNPKMIVLIILKKNPIFYSITNFFVIGFYTTQKFLFY